jgi:hypothetical protein
MTGFLHRFRQAWRDVYYVTKLGRGYFFGGIEIEGGWEDLRFPATGINPPGAVSDPDRNSVNGLLEFDAASTEVIVMQAQLPHSWKLGTDLKPHVHWRKTTSAAGNVLWTLQYKWNPVNEVEDAEWTTLSSAAVSPGTVDINTATQHLITPLGVIPTTGKSISDMLIMRFARVGGDALDTYGADAALLEFDIHYVLNTLGSTAEFTKE